MTHHSRPIHAPTVQSTTKPTPGKQPTSAPTQPDKIQNDPHQPTNSSPLPSSLPATQPLDLSTSTPSPALAPTISPLSCEPPASVRDALLSCDAVCFDVDSTVLTEEGIDVLAAHLGKGAEVAALTSAAMNGGLPFQDALKQRLDLLQPSAASITDCLSSHPLTITPGFLSLLHLLRAHHKQLYLVTGGFIQMLTHLLPRLHIPSSHVYANRLLFTPTGHYTGFDTTQPTSTSGGKAKAITALLTDRRLSRVVMVGDGMTDVEARPPAVCMVGYGGVVVREAVRRQADWFIVDWKQLMDVFETEDERDVREQRMRQEEEREGEEATTAASQSESTPHSNKRKQQSSPSDAPPAAARLSATETMDGTEAAVSAKKARKQRSDKGVKRGQYSSVAESKRQATLQRMSKEQRVAEAAKATSAIDDAMADWTVMSSQHTKS